MDDFQNLIRAVRLFLKAEGINCEMVEEDSATKFWSYSLTRQKMTGFISFHDHDGDPVLSASITIGLLTPDHKLTTTLMLLEANMALYNGLSLASQLEMVVLRFNESIEMLTPVRLHWLLCQLHLEANELRLKFVSREHLLLPLPPDWFEDSNE